LTGATAAAGGCQPAFKQRYSREQNKQGAGTVEYIGADAVKKIAVSLGLDAAKFNSCFDSGKYKDEVNKDMAAGSTAGVSGTPTFFINGKKYFAALTTQQLRQIIDAELAK